MAIRSVRLGRQGPSNCSYLGRYAAHGAGTGRGEEARPDDTTLADAAVWPDIEGRRITEFDRLHHVSIPDDAVGYDQERDCKAGNCMVEALNWFTSVIAEPEGPINVD